MLLALGIPYAYARQEEQHVLTVDARHAPRALAELDSYGRERRFPRGYRDAPARWDEALVGAAGFAAALALANLLDWVRAFGVDWSDLGRIDGERVRAGEVWRCATALCLHADAAHLLANVVFGGLFAALLCLSSGLWAGWLAALAAGVLGNAVNVALHAPSHRSVGASTAVFGMIGSVVVLELLHRRCFGLGFFWRWAPLAVGVFLLGWLGTPDPRSGDPRTDVGAHLSGFAMGSLLGVPLRWLERRSAPRRSVRLALAALPPALLGLAWAIALART